jgi:hypothetical protein
MKYAMKPHRYDFIIMHLDSMGFNLSGCTERIIPVALRGEHHVLMNDRTV